MSPRPRPAARRAPRTGSPDRRLRLLLLATALLFAAVLVRAVQLQAFERHALAARASAQHRQEVVLPAKRGTIRDRNGYDMALMQEATTVGATLADVRDPSRIADALATVAGVSRETTLRALARRGVIHVDLVRKLDPAKARRLRALGLPGLTFTREERRIYASPIGAQLLGLTTVDGRGLTGVELRYDHELRGREGRETYVRDPAGDTISVVQGRPALRGSDLTLTLDRDLQAAAEEEVRAAMRRTRAKGAIAVTLDARTGGILAMASAPRPRVAGPIRAISDAYEPGSTFKPVAVAAGLAEGVITAGTTFDVPYCVVRYKIEVCDHDPHGTQRMTVAEILAKSSNVGTTMIVDEYLSGTGEADHGEYYAPWIERFGFGRPTGVDLPGEAQGIVLPYKAWSGVSVINIPIGQGIAVTPLQLASLYQTIANGGVVRRPHIVARVGGRPAKVPARRIVTTAVARQLTAMLRGVVSDTGTGAEAAVPGYSVAGKTGTTQKIDANGRYSRSRHLPFFVGFAPATRPRVVTLVMVDEPHGQDFGGVVAAPIFKRLTARALRTLRVPPDRPVGPDGPTR